MSERTHPFIDLTKLRIEDDTIHYKLYAQDGSFIPMTIRDTYENRLFVSWVQKFDRYVIPGDDPSPTPESRP